MAEVRYTPRLERPGLAIERGRDQVVTCPVYAGATLTAPASGVCTVRAPSAATVSTGEVSVASSVAEYTIEAADLASHGYGIGWSVEWVLTMPDGAVHTFREVAALCRVGSQPRVTPADLYRFEPYFDPAATNNVWTETGEEQCIEAYLEIEHKLWSDQRRPWLVVSQAALRLVEIRIALRNCCEAMASTGRETYRIKADRYGALANDAWAQVTLDYDQSEDGVADDPANRAGGTGSGWWGGWPGTAA